MTILLLIISLCGVYEITQTHKSVGNVWVKTTVKASSVAEAIDKTKEYPFYRITKVEEVAQTPTLPEIETVIRKAKLLEDAIKNYQLKREVSGKSKTSLTVDPDYLGALKALRDACVDAGITDARDLSK